MATVILKTYRDAIDELLSWGNTTPDEAEAKRARQAITDAYRDVTAEHSWKYFLRHGRLALNAPVTTGTATYTHTGGASERLLTLSSAVMPTWAKYGHIIFDGDTTIYKLATRIDASNATLDATFNPGADVAAGTSYTLYRSVYPLPADFRGTSWQLSDTNSMWSAAYISPDIWMNYERHLQGSDRPWFWTIMGDPRSYGQMAVFLYGRPSADETMDLIYRTTPRDLVFDGYALYSSTGSNVVNAAVAGTSSCTFTGFTLRADVVGAVLRLADASATAAPDGEIGVNRYTEQRIITVRSDTTTVTLDSAWTYGKLSNHFTISDPIDLPEYLMAPFKTLCRRNMALLTHDYKSIQVLEGLYQMQLREAMGRDAMQPHPDSPSMPWYDWSPPGPYYTVADLT